MGLDKTKVITCIGKDKPNHCDYKGREYCQPLLRKTWSCAQPSSSSARWCTLPLEWKGNINVLHFSWFEIAMILGESIFDHREFDLGHETSNQKSFFYNSTIKTNQNWPSSYFVGDSHLVNDTWLLGPHVIFKLHLLSLPHSVLLNCGRPALSQLLSPIISIATLVWPAHYAH